MRCTFRALLFLYPECHLTAHTPGTSSSYRHGFHYSCRWYVLLSVVLCPVQLGTWQFICFCSRIIRNQYIPTSFINLVSMPNRETMRRDFVQVPAAVCLCAKWHGHRAQRCASEDVVLLLFLVFSRFCVSCELWSLMSPACEGEALHPGRAGQEGRPEGSPPGVFHRTLRFIDRLISQPLPGAMDRQGGFQIMCVTSECN